MTRKPEPMIDASGVTVACHHGALRSRGATSATKTTPTLTSTGIATTMVSAYPLGCPPAWSPSAP